MLNTIVNNGNKMYTNYQVDKERQDILKIFKQDNKVKAKNNNNIILKADIVTDTMGKTWLKSNLTLFYFVIYRIFIQ